jgi:hypothetical protein
MSRSDRVGKSHSEKEGYINIVKKSKSDPTYDYISVDVDAIDDPSPTLFELPTAGEGEERLNPPAVCVKRPFSFQSFLNKLVDYIALNTGELIFKGLFFIFSSLVAYVLYLSFDVGMRLATVENTVISDHPKVDESEKKIITIQENIKSLKDDIQRLDNNFSEAKRELKADLRVDFKDKMSEFKEEIKNLMPKSKK